jgi:hypothetical protein
MRRKLTMMVGLVLVLSSLGCVVTDLWSSVTSSGPVVEEVRDVSGTTAVLLAAPGKMTIELGDEEELRIEAQEEVMEDLETEVRGGRLEIKVKPGVNLGATQSFKFYLTVTELEAIEIAGSGDVKMPVIETRQFSAVIAGSGDASMEGLEADDLRLVISGSGLFDIDGGAVTKQIVDISGSGDYRAKDMESDEAVISMAGSGTATVRVSDSLDVDVAGSGAVKYVGNPVVNAHVAGTGEVEQIGD